MAQSQISTNFNSHQYISALCIYLFIMIFVHEVHMCLTKIKTTDGHGSRTLTAVKLQSICARVHLQSRV